MKTKVLIIGSKGSLGKQMLKTFKSSNACVATGLSRKEFDVVKKFSQLERVLSRFRPSHVINCIALTGMLDCEKNINLAYETNTIFPIKLMDKIKNDNVKLIHFSTEVVFIGNKKNKIYSEKDIPNPKSVYGKSKLLADTIVGMYKRSTIVRLPLLFGPTHENQIVSKLVKNFMKNKVTYVAKDIYSTPVNSLDLSKFVLDLVKKDKVGEKKLLHFTSQRYMSLYDLIKLIAKKTNRQNLIMGVNDSYFGQNFKKPKYLGLNSIYNCKNKPSLNLKIK